MAVALSTVAACGGPVTGEAQPATDATTTTSAAESSGSTDAPASLDDVEPCDLLTREEAEQAFGPLREAPERDDLGTARSCTYSPQRRSLGIDVRTDAGLADVQPSGEVTDLMIGGRAAKQVIAAGGTCIVAIEVTRASRVDVAFTGETKDDPCALAGQVAELVEPRLP
ncbi:DUF3558 domain-containing protein [Saccharothrix longispora]|uniref:DUF3558 domain-containing protein n=1 Tax=Saccharothrix longispora TaxID=33920 RepID=UPI0028FDC301|nr:DUF3558 domain-containing protein [Saccharothrix longispora]MBY8851228.1 DUF3558 domain-containing protein [Saccharothrix sp. MB29]MDU0294769.1 DUF3558 domain-containing protein [Saccharothrix longispora]